MSIINRFATEEYVATYVGSGGNVDQSGLTQAQITALDGMFKICAYTADATDAYKAFQTAFGIGGEVEPDEPDVPVVPDEPEKTLTSISATYSGGSVTAGTAVNDLTGIVVTAHYSDGTSEVVTGYTLSGTIAEGENTITVSYGGMTTTFTVTGVAESGENPFDSTTWEEGVRYAGTNFYTGHNNYETCDYVDLSEYATITITNDTWGNTQYNVVWFDAEKTALSNEQGYIAKESTSYPNSVIVSRPDGAVYCRITLTKSGDGLGFVQWGHEFCVISVA